MTSDRVFVTDDGYRLRLVGDRWIDAAAATLEESDLLFDDRDGRPADAWGQPLSGYFTEGGDAR
jgi:hypothetical protein